MKSLRYSVLLLAGLFVASCSQKKFDPTGLAARVNDRTLSIEEVQKNIPHGLPSTDSTRVARLFINNWVEEQAITAMAEKNIPETAEIDRMVEDYRRQLLMWEYRRQLTLRNEENLPDDEEVKEYYEIHKSALKLQRPVIKGIYIKISEDSPHLKDIRKLYRSDKVEDMDRLEKLMDNDVVSYEFFRDKWTDWSTFELRIPLKELDKSPDNFPITNDFIDLTDDGYVYLLDISDRLEGGETMPLDYAESGIVEALQRENAVAYDKVLRKQITDKALRDGVAEIFVAIN